MNDNLSNLAKAISVAQSALEEAEAAAKSAREPRDNIAARIQQMAEERAAIAARRARGEHHPHDGERVVLIDIDTAGLEALLRDAETGFMAANTKYGEARATLATAQVAYVIEEKRLTICRLDDHADTLQKLLAETLAQRNAAAAGLSFEDRAAHRMINRLVSFDALLSSELRQVRALPMRDVLYRARPNWVPTDYLYENVWRLHEGAGLFV